MKNRITKILGVLLTTAVVAGMLASAVPAAAAAQDWERIVTPANNGMIDPRVNWVGPIEKAINGDLYCAVGLGDDPTTPLQFEDDGTTPKYDTDNKKWNQNAGGGRVGWERNEVIIYKSTDNGRKWEPVKAQPFDDDDDWDYYGYTDYLPGMGVIFDIECSSRDANTLWVTNGYDIWRSTNGGSSWTKMVNLFTNYAPSPTNNIPPNGLIVSISVGYVGNVAYTFAATSTFEGTINTNGTPNAWEVVGGVYVNRSVLGTSLWEDLEVSSRRADKFEDNHTHVFARARWDVLDVQVLPDFGENQGVAAVVSEYRYAQLDASGAPTGDEGRTIVTTCFENLQWGVELGDVTLRYNRQGGTSYVDAPLISATIWVPSDFYDDPVVYVGIAPRLNNPFRPSASVNVGLASNMRQGDVYMSYFGLNGAAGNSTDLDVSGSRLLGTAVTDLDGVGDQWGASILVAGFSEGETSIPQTWATQDGGNTWKINDKRPTGGASPLWNVAVASIRVHANFATNGMAWVGTHSRSSDVHHLDDNGDCGLSISALPTDVCDTGYTWNTIWFISTWVDMKVDMAITSDNTIYLTTYADTTVTGGTIWDPAANGGNGALVAVTPGDYQLYSAWRYMDTTGDGVRNWERVNSYSLYPIDLTIAVPELAHFDYVRATSGNDFVMLMDRMTKTIYHSANRGNLWETANRKFPIDDAVVYSVLLVSARNVMIGVDSGTVYYTRNLGNWNALNAFGTNEIAMVTDLRLASNQDIIAGAVGSNGRIYIARSIYSSSNATYATWASAQNLGTSIPAGDWVFVAPANDYATSNYIYVASTDSDGIWYRPYAGSGSWDKADNDSDWFETKGPRGSFTDVAVNDIRYHSNLVTAPGAPGFEAEGNGMAYLNSLDGTSTPSSYKKSGANGEVARVKGRVTSNEKAHAAERIYDPMQSNARVRVAGLWAGPASVGSVILYAFGDDCNIWFYTDTLNQPITGVVVSDIVLEQEDCNSDCLQTYQATVKWNALANVTHYLVIVTKDEPADNYYDAVSYIANDTDDFVSAVIQPASKTAAVLTGLPYNTEYFVSVWGLKYTNDPKAYTTTSNKLTGTVQNMAAMIQGESISSFGAGASFRTPMLAPSVAAPSAGAVVSIRPAFQWSQVVGATSYVLTVADNASFTNPIKTVTTTNTAYGWAASDPELEYGTTYYWRVVATGAFGNSNSPMYVFTTEAAPPPQPTITIPPQNTIVIPTITPIITNNVAIPTIVVPQPTFNIPQLTVVIPDNPPAPTPIWVWIIVAIGAILAIAVIVLIIRTRRVV